MKVFLEVHDGQDIGRRFEILPNVYRAIGRLESNPGQTITIGEDFPLGPEERAVIMAHMERRKSSIGSASSDPDPYRGGFQRGEDILLEDHLISRTHAMIFVDGDGPSLVDLGSTNGTFVNARSITDADLVDGDVIHIGRAWLVVHVE
ncbi:MAG: FHA domain-containing protein [Myxococcales bacterium]|nr:FHA domain-containing protein [Myxococcales bacterium]